MTLLKRFYGTLLRDIYYSKYMALKQKVFRLKSEKYMSNENGYKCFPIHK